MNAFESLVATLMRHEGFWVYPSFRVELTREDKLAINRPSNARWELDLICYKPAGNLVRAVECKSYLDSVGVKHSDLAGGRYAERYKLFTEKSLWDVVKVRLIAQLERAGLCAPSPRVELCLATGKVACDEDRPKLRELALQQGWTLLDDEWLIRSVESLASRGYEDEVATIVAKLLVRAKGQKAAAGNLKMRRYADIFRSISSCRRSFLLRPPRLYFPPNTLSIFLMVRSAH